MKTKISAALLLTVSVLSVSSAMAGNNNYNQDGTKKINVCAPHVDKVQSITADIRTLNQNSTAQEIDNLENKISKRKNSISDLKSEISSIRSNTNAKERRLKKLTENMTQLQAEIDKLIDAEQANITKFQAERDHNKKKRDKCSGGIKGYMCEKKYRKRMKDAEKKRDQAKARKVNHMKKREALPAEKKALPREIAQLKKKLSSANAQLKQVEELTPSVSQMERRLRSLEQQNQDQVVQKKKLKKKLKGAETVLEKCRHQRFQSRVYDVVMEQAQSFRSRPSLCNEVDYLIDVADKEYKKQGIQNAAQLVCDMALELQELSIDDDTGPVIEDQVIRLDREITSPMGVNGNYPDNFRTINKQAKLIDKIGQTGISKISFEVEFDIEKNYDYLLIKDADGNIVEKIDGEGQKTVVVESSHVEILFYSDGMTGGTGFTIDQIELHR